MRYLVLLFLIFGCFSTQNAEVERVIDGDTIKLANGSKVRLLGINTPEEGERFYKEAKLRLEQYITSGDVFLDIRGVDKYGRLLAYVYINNTLINKQLVKEGLAIPYFNYFYEDYVYDFLEAEDFARKNRLNLWNSKNPCSYCLELYLNRDAPGNDCTNPEGEWVKITNNCNISCVFNATLRDVGSNRMQFLLNLTQKESFIIYSGCKEGQFCNKKSCKAIWDNDWDFAYLLDNGYIIAKNYN